MALSFPHLAATYADWNLVLGIFVAVTTLIFAVLGVFLVRRIVQEDRLRRKLHDRLHEAATDTERIRGRLEHAPFGRLSALADRLRRAGILVGDLGGSHAGRKNVRRVAYAEAEQGYAPFDRPDRIHQEIAAGKTLEVRPADPRIVAEAKREYAICLKIVSSLYRSAHHVARRNTRVVEEVEALHHRMYILKRSLVAGAIAFAALVALPLGLIVAVPTRPLSFHIIDVTITVFAARMTLLLLFVAGTAATTWLLWRALDKVDLNGPRLALVADHIDPRAFNEALAVPDERREARLRATESAPIPPMPSRPAPKAPRGTPA